MNRKRSKSTERTSTSTDKIRGSGSAARNLVKNIGNYHHDLYSPLTWTNHKTTAKYSSHGSSLYSNTSSTSYTGLQSTQKRQVNKSGRQVYQYEKRSDTVPREESVRKTITGITKPGSGLRADKSRSLDQSLATRKTIIKDIEPSSISKYGNLYVKSNDLPFVNRTIGSPDFISENTSSIYQKSIASSHNNYPHLSTDQTLVRKVSSKHRINDGQTRSYKEDRKFQNSIKTNNEKPQKIKKNEGSLIFLNSIKHLNKR